MPNPNLLVQSIPRSGIRHMMQLAAASPKAIRLDIGDPDFPTPAHVVEAAHQAARAGATHYLPSTGLPELRDVLADKVRQVNGVPASAGQVIVTQGATQALFATLAVVAPNVPGGVVSNRSEEIDKSGRLVRRSTLRLIDYSADPQKDRGLLRKRAPRRAKQPARYGQ